MKDSKKVKPVVVTNISVDKILAVNIPEMRVAFFTKEKEVVTMNINELIYLVEGFYEEFDLISMGTELRMNTIH